MEENIASSSSKQLNVNLERNTTLDNLNKQIEATGDAEDPLNHDKISSDASPTSFSSSSQLLEVDYDENAFDIPFSISGEDEDIYNNRQWSMVSTSPLAETTEVEELPLSPEIPPENLSPTQSPVVQVMERSDSYDPNRIPSSTFSRKSTNATDWSADSSDSLFSIPLEKSDELNSAIFLSRLPTVTETSEIDQKSTLGEFEAHTEAPIVCTNGNGANQPEIPCESETTVPPPPPPPPPLPPVPEENVAAETKSGDNVTTPKGRCRCFNCFSCCTVCG